jgi:mannitol-1-/sugar-/sorbitol-6-phosphatase
LPEFHDSDSPTPANCIVIEDSTSGAKACHAAGCKVLATTFSHAIEQLTAAGWLVESLAEVRIVVLLNDRGLELEFTPLSR